MYFSGKRLSSVRSPDFLRKRRAVSGEAESSFKNGAVYLEKLIERPRHIEIQVLGDHHGNLIHLGERECSLQRRHQKVIEESPSPLMAARPELRAALGEAALAAARSAGYFNAGTVEFLVGQDGNFYFLEMNTRLQIEHPVTELVTGIDLVQWQLRIAAGERLTLRQEDILWRGAAMECRVCAEDPDLNFMPSSGRIQRMSEPGGPGIRVDSGVYSGWTVPNEYDSLLAKLIGFAENRGQVINRLLRAIDEYALDGIQTNLHFLRTLLESPAFVRGELHTGFIEEFTPGPAPGAPEMRVAVALAALAERSAKTPIGPSPPDGSSWLRMGREGLMR